MSFFFTFVYLILVYIYLSILLFGFSYERAKERVRETWLFIFMKKAFTLERQALMFFLKIGFIISSFGLFVWSYKLMFGEVERGNLVNPLQVVAQLASFLFHLKYPARVRHLLLLCFFLSLVSSLHLKGIDGRSFLSFFFSSLWESFFCLWIMPISSWIWGTSSIRGWRSGGSAWLLNKSGTTHSHSFWKEGSPV